MISSFTCSYLLGSFLTLHCINVAQSVDDNLYVPSSSFKDHNGVTFSDLEASSISSGSSSFIETPPAKRQKKQKKAKRIHNSIDEDIFDFGEMPVPKKTANLNLPPLQVSIDKRLADLHVMINEFQNMKIINPPKTEKSQLMVENGLVKLNSIYNEVKREHDTKRNNGIPIITPEFFETQYKPKIGMVLNQIIKAFSGDDSDNIDSKFDDV